MVKVVDYFNGWESESMSMEDADKYIATHPAPTGRGVEPSEAEWRYDARYNEYAWFVGAMRVS